MTYLLIAFLGITLVPLFAASWRVSVLGLALQGLVLGWVAVHADPHPGLSTLVALVDLVVLRGLVAPHLLYRAMAASNVPRRNHVIPSNLFSWALVGGLVFVAFNFATAISKSELAESSHLATATSALLLGMFVLSTQNSMFSQMIGLIRIENAIALFELGSPRHPGLLVQFGVTSVFAASLLFIGRFLEQEQRASADTNAAEGSPTL